MDRGRSGSLGKPGPSGLSLCCAALAVLATPACTWIDRRNRRALDYTNAELSPDSTTGRIALAPLSIPIGLTAVAVDTVVLTPAHAFDDAWIDTRNVLWDSWSDDSPLRRAVWAPFGAILTPVTYVGSFAVRSVFPVEPARPRTRRPKATSSAADADQEIEDPQERQ